jgi:hypothetical protein
VLIAILLPALSKARDQGKLVACMSNLHQFYALEAEYAAENHGYYIPCKSQGNNAEYDFFEPLIIGPLLNKTKGAFENGTDRVKNEAGIIKAVFTCPAMDHTTDPDVDNTAAMGSSFLTNNAYWGDYIYNQCIGSLTTNNGTPLLSTYQFAFCKVGQVPNNVVIMMETTKPNFPTPSLSVAVNTVGYKIYFGGFGTPGSVAGTMTPLFDQNASLKCGWGDLFASGQPKPIKSIGLQLYREGTYHVRNTKMNVLCADGHIATVDPRRDFFGNVNDQTTFMTWLFSSGDMQGDITQNPPTTATTTHPNWKKGAPGV